MFRLGADAIADFKVGGVQAGHLALGDDYLWTHEDLPQVQDFYLVPVHLEASEPTAGVVVAHWRGVTSDDADGNPTRLDLDTIADGVVTNRIDNRQLSGNALNTGNISFPLPANQRTQARLTLTNHNGQKTVRTADFLRNTQVGISNFTHAFGAQSPGPGGTLQPCTLTADIAGWPDITSLTLTAAPDYPTGQVVRNAMRHLNNGRFSVRYVATITGGAGTRNVNYTLQARNPIAGSEGVSTVSHVVHWPN